MIVSLKWRQNPRPRLRHWTWLAVYPQEEWNALLGMTALPCTSSVNSQAQHTSPPQDLHTTSSTSGPQSTYVIQTKQSLGEEKGTVSAVSRTKAEKPATSSSLPLRSGFRLANDPLFLCTGNFLKINIFFLDFSCWPTVSGWGEGYRVAMVNCSFFPSTLHIKPQALELQN